MQTKSINRISVCKNKAFGCKNRSFVFTAKGFVLSSWTEKGGFLPIERYFLSSHSTITICYALSYIHINYIKTKKHRQSSDYQCFLLSRGDWIRTSDHTPPRAIHLFPIFLYLIVFQYICQRIRNGSIGIIYIWLSIFIVQMSVIRQ